MRREALVFRTFHDLVQALHEHPEWREELRRLVLTEELLSLPQWVRELAEAQQRTEQRVEELVEAQKRTEERLEQLTSRFDQLTARFDQLTARFDQLTVRFDQLAARVEQLAEAQQRTEEQLQQLTARVYELTVRFDHLTARVDQLAEVQQRTEQRMEELAEAQRRSDERVAQLAAAQQRTEETVRQLVVDMKHVKEELGGLSHAVGYGLENLAYRTLPRLFQERFGLTVTEPLRRRFLPVGDRQLEVNLWGLAQRPEGQVVRVLGEAKTRLSAAKHFKGVERLLKFTRPHWGTEEALVVLVCHLALPGTEEEARRRGWYVVESWELESTSSAPSSRSMARYSASS